MVWVTAEVDVSLEELDDEDIRQEAEDRGLFETNSELIQSIYEAYIFKQHDEVNRLLKDLFYKELGRIV